MCAGYWGGAVQMFQHQCCAIGMHGHRGQMCNRPLTCGSYDLARYIRTFLVHRFCTLGLSCFKLFTRHIYYLQHTSILLLCYYLFGAEVLHLSGGLLVTLHLRCTQLARYFCSMLQPVHFTKVPGQAWPCGFSKCSV